jgi:hypothetical protein
LDDFGIFLISPPKAPLLCRWGLAMRSLPRMFFVSKPTVYWIL